MVNGPEISFFISGSIPGVFLLYHNIVFSWAEKALSFMGGYIMWAGVKDRNEPFLGFSILVCLNNRKKVNWGR